MSNVIAIVGRPNVGKSALFNRIVGKRIAIVHDEPGVTRDRITAEAEWKGRRFTLADTGGIGLAMREKTDDVIKQAALDQVQIAIESAEVILFVVNAREGLMPLDREVADRLRKSQKQILVAANKVDSDVAVSATAEFTELGFEHVFPISAIHNRGIEDLLNKAVIGLPTAKIATGREQVETNEAENEVLKLTIVGRPNVGKSSLVNTLTQSDRVIVSPIPGTTRDSIDVPFEIKTDGGIERYVLIDTAGFRQKRRIDNSVEFFSVQRAEESVARCDIAILVIDAEEGISTQDKKIAGKIVEERKACIVVINKWDLVSEEVLDARKEEIALRNAKTARRTRNSKMTTLSEFGEWVQKQLFFLDYAPVLFTSAKSGFHLERLMEAVRFVASQLRQKIPTAILNRTLNDSIQRRQPISSAGHRLKFFYATQIRRCPPTFVLFVNRDELFSESYSKHLSRDLRKAFGYEGCPIILIARPRPKKK
ncbi:MAG: ribosome biogenesis GTPase Der [Verrucomicrobia bacterium]|nr:ribosome biogenesis GTPase Der [Verrucomicrobiota bacterium]